MYNSKKDTNTSQAHTIMERFALDAQGSNIDEITQQAAKLFVEYSRDEHSADIRQFAAQALVMSVYHDPNHPGISNKVDRLLRVLKHEAEGASFGLWPVLYAVVGDAVRTEPPHDHSPHNGGESFSAIVRDFFGVKFRQTALEQSLAHRRQLGLPINITSVFDSQQHATLRQVEATLVQHRVRQEIYRDESVDGHDDDGYAIKDQDHSPKVSYPAARMRLA